VPISDTHAAVGAGLIILFFVIWVLIVGVGDDFVCWIGGKGNLSGWVQAIGSIGAIFGIWWQTNHQIQEGKNKLLSEKKEREISVLERAIFLISNFKDVFDEKKLKITSISMKSADARATLEVIGLLDITSRQLMDYPYWELPDTRVAIDLQKVIQACGVLRLEMENPSLETLNRLDEMLAVCHHALVVCNARLTLRKNMN
jgi:hypothetical protein